MSPAPPPCCSPSLLLAVVLWSLGPPLLLTSSCCLARHGLTEPLDEWKNTAMHFACYYNRFALVQILVQMSSDLVYDLILAENDAGETPLMVATAAQADDELVWLIRQLLNNAEKDPRSRSKRFGGFGSGAQEARMPGFPQGFSGSPGWVPPAPTGEPETLRGLWFWGTGSPKRCGGYGSGARGPRNVTGATVLGHGGPETLRGLRF